MPCNNRLYNLIIISLFSVSISNAQTLCENGMAGKYPCENIDLLSVLTPSQLLAENTEGFRLSDIWGWTDANTGKEYALVGLSNGVSFVDISNPLIPIVLGILPEHHSASGRLSNASSVWRDMKVYKNHAFIVSEDKGHGMQVFDLEILKSVESPPVTFSESAHYDGISNAHNIVINEATGYAYATGARGAPNCGNGGLHIIDINDPINPIYAGCFDTDGYTHDAQCVIYNGPDADYVGQEICISANENLISIANVTDKNDTKSIATITYAESRYIHQGWLSPDHKYYYSNDELDELNDGTNTKTFVWNVEDLDNPVLLNTYIHDGVAIDHNLYCKDTLIYESNYTSGLRILNAKNVTTSGLEEVAFFDTYNQSDATKFDGTWSNYPFFESGNIIVSDITNGLFILKYNPSKNTDNGKITSIDSDQQNSWNIYPNPAAKYFKINIIKSLASSANIVVYDFSGKIVISSTIDLLQSKENTFDSSYLKKGLYHIKISYQNKRIVKKLIIE